MPISPTSHTVRHLRPALLAATALSLATPALAQDASPYSRVVVFGDSISDSGAYADRAPAGAGRFTTNPDPVWVEGIAAGLGLPLQSRAAGGTNYAEGGARVAVSRDGAPGDLSRTPVVKQVDAFLSGGGRLGAGDLVIIQGGGNDVFATQLNGPGFTPADLMVLDQAARDLAGQVQRIADAGDATIVTTSVPRFEAFNGSYRAALTATGTNVLYVDIAKLISEIETNPGEFGIVNVTDRACRGRAVESFICLPADYVTPDANRTYLFADGVHFTGVVHQIEADAVLAALRAPAQVGQLPLAGQAVLQFTRAALATQMGPAELQRSGGWTVFGWADGSRLDIDPSARANGLRADAAGATMGAAYALRPWLSLGGALTWSQTDGDFGADTGGFDMRTVLLTAFGQARIGAFDARADASYGDLEFDDVRRRIALGPAERTEAGDTHGRMWAAGVELGATTAAGPVSVRPLLGLRYERIEVGAYAEAGTRSTQATFGDQTLEALLGSVGAEVGWAPAAAWRAQPFLRISYEADLLDDDRTLTLTPSGAPVGFTTAAFTPDDRYVAYAVGVSGRLRPGLTGIAEVVGTLGRGSLDAAGLRVGVRGRF